VRFSFRKTCLPTAYIYELYTNIYIVSTLTIRISFTFRSRTRLHRGPARSRRLQNISGSGKLGEESPNFARCKALWTNIIACIPGKCNVVSIESSPLRRVLAPIIHSLDALSAVGGRFGRILSLAPVVFDKAVSDLSTIGDVQDTVLDTMLAVECNRIASSTAARELCPRQDGNTAIVFGIAAGQAVGHGRTVGEADGETEVLVHTKIILDLLSDRVQERDIFAILVRPSLVDAIWCHENSALIRESRETVVRC